MPYRLLASGTVITMLPFHRELAHVEGAATHGPGGEAPAHGRLASRASTSLWWSMYAAS